MEIRYFATIRELTGENAHRWDNPAGELGHLLRGLSGRYGLRFREAVMDDGELSKTIIILINGYDARHQGGVHAVLHPDDTVSIFPMVAGG